VALGITDFPDGRQYMTPDLVGRLKDEQIVEYLGGGERNKREMARARDELASKLRAMIIDRVDYAIIKPDAKTQLLTNWGLKRGTAAGEAVRMLMQFKSFPLAMIQKVWAREMYGHGANTLSEALFKGKGDLRAMAHIMVASTAFGYMAMTAKDTIKGRKPRDPTKASTWLAAFMQGGGAGLYGDFLFGTATRHGNSALVSLLGPSASTLEDGLKLYQRAMAGDDVAAGALKMVINNTPFANLFWARPTMDYLFLYDLQESMNPGYLGRMERSVKQNNDQEYFLKPTTDRLRPFTGAN